ncbi:MAG: response regulator transcription factor [Ghiorsea sp.]
MKKIEHQPFIAMQRNILVIDDEDVIRMLLSEMLAHLGYAAAEAANKEDVLLRIQETQFDLIFIDIFYVNANYTGFDLIELIKEKQPHAQLVILTAKPSMHSAVRALRSHVLDYLEKPICIDMVSSILNTAFPEPSPHEENLHIMKEDTSESLLTDKELVLLSLLAKGLSYNQTAEQLNCKTSTIQWHIKNIYRKLNVNSKSEAIYEAICMKLIQI